MQQSVLKPLYRLVHIAVTKKISTLCSHTARNPEQVIT